MWFLGLAGLLAVSGVVLLCLGVRGRRIDTHPWCRKCRYDLSGAETAPAVCPECGSDLARRRSVRQGRRRRRPLLLVPGGVLLLLAAGGAGAMLWPQARDFDWNTVKPAWLLAWEAESGSAGRARSARSELIGRIETGRLSTGRIESLVETALAVQVDSEAAWSGQWGTLIEAAWYVDRIDDDMLRRYLQGAFVPEPVLRLQSRARGGGTITLGVDVPLPRGAEGTSLFDGHFRFIEARLVDRRARLQRSARGHWTFTPKPPALPRVPKTAGARPDLHLMPPSLSPMGPGTGAGSRWYDAGVAAVAEPGRHEITVTCAIALVPRQDLDPDPAQRPSFSSFRSTGGTGEGYSRGGSPRREAPEGTLVQWPIELTGTVEIVPEEVELVELITDAALREAVAGSITVEELQLRLSEHGIGSCSARVVVSNPPVDLSFDAVVRAGDSEAEFMRGIICRKGQVDAFRLMGTIRNLSDRPESIELHLRPAPRAAEDLVGMDRIWGEDVVLADLPAETTIRGGATSRRPVPKGRAGPATDPVSADRENLEDLIAAAGREDSRTAVRAIRRIAQRVEEFPAARLAGLVDETLERQADRDAVWVPEWGSFVETAMFAGLLTEEQTARYLRQVIDGAIELVVRPRVRAGATAPFAVIVQPRAGTGRPPRLAMQLHPVRAAVGDPPEALAQVPAGTWSLRSDDPSRGSSRRRGSLVRRRGRAFDAGVFTLTAPLRPGPHEIVLDYEVRIVASGRSGSRRRSTPPGPPPEPAAAEPVLSSSPLRLRAPFDVIEADVSTVTLDETDACREAVEAALRIDAIAIAPDSADPERAVVQGQVRVGPLDVALSFRAFVQIAGREIPAGGFMVRPGSDSFLASIHAFLADPPDEPVDTAVLILRPDPDPVESSLEILEIAGHEIVRENLPVEYGSR